MDKNHIAVRLYLCFAMAITMVSAQVQGIEGGTIRITCSVAGILPRWTKDASITFTNEGNSMINPEYSSRFSYAADQKTLIVNPVQLSDAGRYACFIGGILGTDVVMSVIKQEGHCSTLIAVYTFYGLAVVILIVVIMICIYKLKIKDPERTKKVVILIVAVVLIIAVTAWFIPMQVTMEDCEKVTEEDHKIFIGLLVFEIIAFLGGVIGIIILLHPCCG